MAVSRRQVKERYKAPKKSVAYRRKRKLKDKKRKGLRSH
ncbi:hypothetical protein J2749_001028 [Methanobacterium oryzae]